MITLRSAVVVCVTVGGLLAGRAGADEPLIQTRSKGPQWARYFVTLDINGEPQQIFWHVRDTGGEQLNGKDCRKLEFALFDAGKQTPDQVYQLLIPEAAFGSGKNPVRDAVRVRSRNIEGKVEDVSALADRDILLATMLDGLQGEARVSADQEKVAWQRGEFDCSVHEGVREASVPFGSLRIVYRVRRHDEAPWGVAGFTEEWKIATGDNENTVKVNAVLEDFGDEPETFFP